MTGCLGWRPRREPGARSTPATTIPAARLTDYRTGEDIRTATSEEVEASKAAAETDGGGKVWRGRFVAAETGKPVAVSTRPDDGN